MAQKLSFLMAFVVLLALAAPPASAADYYIDPVNGSDSTGDGSLNTPWKSFQNIMTYYGYDPPSGWVNIAPGDTIYLMNGVYSEKFDTHYWEPANRVAFFKNESGDSSNVYYIKAYPGHNPILDPQGGGVGLQLQGCDWWDIEGIEVRNAYGRGVLIQGGNVKIHGVHIHDTDGVDNNNIAGLEVHSSPGFELYDSVLNDNYDRTCADTSGNATENSANMVLFSDSGDIIIHDCDFYQSLPLSDPKSGGGLKYKHASQDPESTFQVYNCTFTNHKFFAFGTGTSGTNFHHNLINGGAGIISRDFGGTTHQTNQLFEYNTIYGASGFGMSPTDGYVNVDFPDDPTDVVFQNNIVYDIDTSYGSEDATISIGTYMTDDIYDQCVAALSFSNNCYYNPDIACQFNLAAGGWASEGGQFSLSGWQTEYGYDTDSIENDPCFVDPNNGDFHLESGSPAEGMGMYAGTGPQPPGQASNPSPANSADDISIDANLSWSAGSGATSRDVYFGTSSPGSFQGNQTAATFEPDTLNYNTPYYWRIDEINAEGTTTGNVWTFTTEAETVLLPWTDGFESGDLITGGWTTSGNASASNKAEYTGTYGAAVKGTAWMEKAISTAGFTAIHVKYIRKTKSLDSGEYLYVEYNDGTQWNELEATQATSWASQDKTCGSSADNNAGFKIRFRTNASNANEYAYIDDVEITGTSQ